MNEYLAKNWIELERMTTWLFEHNIPCKVGIEPYWYVKKTVITVKFGVIDDELFHEFDELFGEILEDIDYEIGA